MGEDQCFWFIEQLIYKKVWDAHTVLVYIHLNQI